jgi:hypothetical protein
MHVDRKAPEWLPDTVAAGRWRAVLGVEDAAGQAFRPHPWSTGPPADLCGNGWTPEQGVLFTVAVSLLSQPVAVLPPHLGDLMDEHRYYAWHAEIAPNDSRIPWLSGAAGVLADRFYGRALAEALEWLHVTWALKNMRR